MGKPVDDFLRSNSQGYSIKQGDFFEWLITQNIATSLMVSEVLRRQLKLEYTIKNEEINDEVILNKLKEIANSIAEQATSQKNSLIAELYIKNKESD